MSSGEWRQVNVPLLLERLRIEAEQKGRLHWASCPHPDHDDSTPSWRIIDDPDHEKHGQHRCYGCGFGGWPVHLVEALLKLDRQEAHAWLEESAEALPLPLSVEVVHAKPSTTFALPKGVRFAQLQEWPDEAKGYLVKRGVTASQVLRWGLGYTHDGWSKTRNPFPGRVFVPVRDGDGELISYTARTYLGHPLRYREPSRSEGADLGAVFGEQHWPSVGERKVLVVTEGAFNALAVERVCKLPIAALYGSYVHQGHVLRLSTFDEIIMASDPDKAGNKLAQEVTQQLARWVTVRRMVLPAGKDANDLAPAQLVGALRAARAA